MQLDVYEYFIWHPWVVAQEVEGDDFSDLFPVPRGVLKGLRELYRSVRLCKFRPAAELKLEQDEKKRIYLRAWSKKKRQREKMIFEGIKELYNSGRIVDYTPFEVIEYSGIPETNRLLALLKIGKMLQNIASTTELYNSAEYACYEPDEKFTALADPEVLGQVICEAGVIVTVTQEWNGNKNLCFSEAVRLVQFTPEEAMQIGNMLKGNVVNDKNVVTEQEQKEPILKRWLGYYVQPKSPDERASMHVKTFPWLVLDERDGTLIVERITKTGEKRPARFHKDFMEVVQKK